jgi:hypothetical protein
MYQCFSLPTSHSCCRHVCAYMQTGELQGTLQLGAPLNALATWAPQSRERYVVLGCSDRVSVVELPN